MAKIKAPKHPNALPREVSEEWRAEVSVFLQQVASLRKVPSAQKSIEFPSDEIPSLEALRHVADWLSNKKPPRLKQLPKGAGRYVEACFLIREYAASGEATNFSQAVNLAAEKLCLTNTRQIRAEWEALYGAMRPVFGGIRTAPGLSRQAKVPGARSPKKSGRKKPL